MRRFVVFLTAVSVAVSISLTVPAFSKRSSAAPLSSTTALRRWAATMGGSQVVTAAQAVADAQNVNMIVGLPNTYSAYVASMRAANPSLKLVAYMNSVYASGAGSNSYPEAWYLHDATGARILSTNFANPLMDPTNTGWIQSRTAGCQAALTASGWDGCYLDMLGAGTLTPGYLTSTPINPLTGVAWTTPEWVAATSALATTVTSSLPGVFLVGNGLGDGAQYFSPAWGPSSLLVNPLAAADAQGFVRGDSDPATTYRSESKWRSDVDMLVDANTRGKSVMVEAKVWAPGITQDQMNSIHRYALATFLLGTNGGDSWYWSDTGSESAVVEDTAYDHLNIGTPIGSYAKMSGAYQRRYSRGLVLVNPTASAVTVPLPSGQMTTLDGTVVQGQITLAPNTGDVLATTTSWGPIARAITGLASNITPSSATISGLVNAKGLATTVQAEFGSTNTLGGFSVPVAAGTGTVRTAVQVGITGLNPGTTYTYHLVATNSAGTTAGIDLTFTTLLPPPGVRTAGAIVNDPTSTTVTGYVNPSGLPTTYQVDYGLDTNYGTTTTAQSGGNGTTFVAQNVTIAGLTPGSVVHYRFVATNSTGTTYGLDRTIHVK